jgi:UDP-glucose 4-epimerase
LTTIDRSTVNVDYPELDQRWDRYLTQLGVGGTAAVLQAAHASSVGQLVHMSSVGTYAAGSYVACVDESWPTKGIESSPYCRDKSAEARLNEYEQRHSEMDFDGRLADLLP